MIMEMDQQKRQALLGQNNDGKNIVSIKPPPLMAGVSNMKLRGALKNVEGNFT